LVDNPGIRPACRFPGGGGCAQTGRGAHRGGVGRRANLSGTPRMRSAVAYEPSAV